MLKHLPFASWLTGRKTAAAPEYAPRSTAKPVERSSVPIYPPVDRGIEFVEPDHMLAAQDEIIRRIRLASGFDASRFDLLYTPVLANLARVVNTLPASETGTHQGAGGLYRLSLEMAFYALQASESVIFSAHVGVESRRNLEPRWRYAAFLAGLCVELYRPLTTCVVTSEDGDVWPAYRVGLGDWLAQKSLSRYFVKWVDPNAANQKPGRGAVTYFVNQIITADSFDYLQSGSIDIATTLLDVVSGIGAGAHRTPLTRIVDEVRERVLARDEAIRPTTYGKMTVGTHAEPHLLDAMRRLCADGVWKINERKARLWWSDDGLFLVWKTAAKEMVELLRADGVGGIPSDAQTLLDLLCAAGVFALDNDDNPYHSIYPAENELLAVKFVNPLTILASLADEPTKVSKLTVPPSERTKPERAPAQPAKEVTPAPSAEAPVAEPTDKPDPSTMQTEPDLPDPVAVEPASTERKVSEPIPTTERDVGQEVRGDFAKLMSPLLRDVIGSLIEDMRAGQVKNQAGRVQGGFAISAEQIASYGVNLVQVIEELHKLGWLVTYPEKPNKKLHEVQINGKASRAIILKQPIAVDLGVMS